MTVRLGILAITLVWTPALAQSPACVTVDSTLAFRHDWVAPEQADSVRAVITGLEQRLAKAGDAEVPELLLRLGRANAMFTPEEAHAKARPNEFFLNEIAGNWLYTGWHLKELIQRFADSHLADDAAYELTRLPLGGECEGFTSCYVYAGFHRVAEFLRSHPQSPYADSATARALSAFHFLKAEMDLRHGSEYEEVAEIRKLVAELDTLGRALPSQIGSPLLTRAGDLWEQMGEYERARSAFGAVVASQDVAARDCVAARLAALPARWFELERPQVIRPGRVELRWQPSVDRASAFIVYRSPERSTAGAVVARLPASIAAWTDTTTEADRTYWYRIIAETPSGAVGSHLARAVTPSRRIRVLTIAVSVTDGHLYAFGHLANGFPKVLRVSPVDGRVQETDGEFFAGDTYARSENFLPYVSDYWLPDAGGVGVLHFRGTAGAVPGALLGAVRRGATLLRPPGADEQPPRLLVSVDEPRSAAWVQLRGGSPIAAMDCFAETSHCWLAGMRELTLADDTGRVTARAPLPALEPNNNFAYPSHLFADPRDGSAWILYRQEGRLLNVDRSGRLRRDVSLAQRGRLGTATADFAHRALWFARWAGGGKMELVRLDLSVDSLPQRVVPVDGKPIVFLAPDLNGGVWIGRSDEIVRIGRDGRQALTVALPREP